MLPMMGLLGIDYGYGFDNTGTTQKGRFHFILGQQF
jgi:outer membrane protein insertion porin family